MGGVADTVPPFIAAHLSHLLSHFPLTLKVLLFITFSFFFPKTTPFHSLPFQVHQMWSSDKYNSTLFDRFTLLIPYCLDFIKWDIIYNADSPSTAPDFIFGPEDHDFHPFHMNSTVEPTQPNNYLKDWNYKDPSRLLALVQFLRDQYVLYQRKRVEAVDDDRLKFEISTIISREGIEMHLTSSAEKPEEVKFAVPLMDMNINKMVPCCPWRHSQKIYLQVVYPVGRKYLSAPSAPRLKLVSSPELKSLFSIDDIKLPSWLDGMCLAEYLPNLEEYLGKQVLEAVSLVDVRRHFIEALACQFGRPVEADPVFCRKATFLSASGVFTFLVHFIIPTQFPKQQPALMLQSSQHFNTQMAPMKSRLIADYPWSPRWEIPLMAERICEFLADESLNFKRQCSEGQLQ